MLSIYHASATLVALVLIAWQFFNESIFSTITQDHRISYYFGLQGTHSDQPVVTLKNGSYSGLTIPSLSQEVFLGIPYAQLPRPPLRFFPPKSLNTTWKTTRFAIKYAHTCPSAHPRDLALTNGMSEDCLYLNIVRPSLKTNPELYKKKLPILVWIHGGSYQIGSSSMPEYNLSYITSHATKTSKPIISISMNYRKGPWGLLYSEEIKKEGSENLAIKDVLLALRWIKENLGAFGGDIDNVTIMGESSGSFMVGQLVVAFGGKGETLFHKAIQQSGSASTASYNGTDWYEHKYQAILQQTNCDSLTCLRNLPYEELYPALDNSVSGSWYPVIDGNIFPFHPSKLLSTGQYNHVPIIHGSTTDEGTDNAISGIDTTSQLHSYLLNEIGLPFIKESPNPARIIDELLRYYPENPSLGIPHGVSLNYEAFPHLGKQYKRLAAIVGDIYYHSHVPLDARVYSKNAPTYIYRFDTLPWNPATNSTKMLGENGELVDSYKGVAHFSDIAYMFHNPQFHGEDPEHVEVADKMTDLWVSFVVDGVPSLSGAGVGREYIWDTYYDGRAKKHEGFGRTLVMRPSSKGGFVIEKDDYRVKERAYLARLMQEFNNIMEKS